MKTIDRPKVNAELKADFLKRQYEAALEEIQRLKADRPQGEWIDKGWKGDWQFETDGRGNCWKVFECSICNGWDTRKTRFCPHCGARMKGANDE
jgi:hypothetical protein